MIVHRNFFQDIFQAIMKFFSRGDPVIPKKTETDEVVIGPIKEDSHPLNNEKWFPPIRVDKFHLTQGFLEPNPIYKITGHHPGVDYGTQGEDNVPLYYCADGEVVDSGLSSSCGNNFFYYVPTVDRTFVYFHLRDGAPSKGFYKGGDVCGITGQTGMSEGIHLHFECIKGKITMADRGRLYVSKSAIQEVAEDADAFIRARI